MPKPRRAWMPLVLALSIGCQKKAADKAPVERAGTDTSARGGGLAALSDPLYIGDPLPNLTPEQTAKWKLGQSLFTKVFAVADGVGPLYNNVQCAACHYIPNVGGNGDVDRGVRLTSTQGAKSLYLWMRHSIPGVPEPTAPPDAKIVLARPPPLYGIAQFDSLSDAELTANCDPDDRDHDGIRGHSVVRRDGKVGRFGHKLTQPSLLDMVSYAALEEMGITNPGQGARARPTDTDAVADPEMKMEDVDALVAYVRGLAPPPRDGNDAAGEKVFAKVGCATCHQPTLAGKIPGVYSDLCAHDMGPAFDTGVNEVNYSFTPTEMRTAPLWGLRFRHAFFHDDRAKSVDAAIRQHGGEAKAASDRYAALAGPDREALLRFLDTL